MKSICFLALSACVLMGVCNAGYIGSSVANTLELLHAAPSAGGASDGENESAQYEFQYSVHDGHTGDVKDQFEHRRGNYVTGRYSLLDADGLQRVVEYSADPLLGFTAEVRRELPKITLAPIEHQQTAASATAIAADGELDVAEWPQQ